MSLARYADGEPDGIPHAWRGIWMRLAFTAVLVLTRLSISARSEQWDMNFGDDLHALNAP